MVKRKFVCNLLLLLSLAIAPALAAQTPPSKARKTRLVVSFESICCGTDHKSQDRLDEFLARYEKMHRLILAKKKVYWGREGEFDYCFPLTNLSGKRQKRLIADLKTLLQGAELVRLRENSPCTFAPTKLFGN